MRWIGGEWEGQVFEGIQLPLIPCQKRIRDIEDTNR